MKKLILTISSIIFIVIFSVIVGKYTTKKEENTLTKIKVSEVTHSVFYAPWYVAIENNYFKDEGIEIELTLTPGADKVATSVYSNDSDIGLSGPEATIYLYNNSKEKLISFASLTKRDGQFIIGDCSLKETFSLNDLIGKKVLAGRSGGMPLMMFMYALKESNIDYNLIDIDTSVDFASLSGAYISNQGDFVNLFEPNATNIEKEHYGCVLSSLGNISGVVPYTTFYAKEEYINNNKDLLKRFNKALNKGLEFVKEHDSISIAQLILNQFPDTNIDDLITIVDRYKENDSWYDTTYINENDYDRLQDILIYGNSINKKIDSSLLITNEFNK